MRKILILLIAILVSCTDNSFLLNQENGGLIYNPLFNSKVDVLMIVDNSGSMEQHQNYLASSTQDFAKRLVDLGFDFHLGVTSTDTSANGHKGKLIGSTPFLVTSSGDLETKLRSRILIGASGSNVEEGLKAAKLASSEPNISETNAGFFRPDAFLALIVLSNEDDAGTEPVQSFIDHFQMIKPPLPGRERGWVLNFIGVTGARDEDCKTFGDYKGVGNRYMEIANFSRGRVDTICTANLSSAIKGLEKALLTLLTEIPLSRQPAAGTLRVLFNGTPVPNDNLNGWTYETEKNSILFHGNYIPKTKTKIDIFFDPINPK